MSKIIYVCYKQRLPISIENDLLSICNNLIPDNLEGQKTDIYIGKAMAYAVLNPNSDFLEQNGSICLGQIFGNKESWDKPNHNFPDGNFAIFRNNDNEVEIASDFVGTRSVWYYLDDEKLVASTSQRAIAMYLKSFEFDKRVVPWILSSGSLGTFSWDKRFKRIDGNSSIVLNKKSWKLQVKTNDIHFRIEKKSNNENQNILLQALKSTIASLNINFANWALPLSGGYDSRGILCLLKSSEKNLNDLKSITWGLKSSLLIKNNDAYIAKELANSLHIENKYFNTDLPEESAEQIINRFIKLGEGRIDHISGYLDGFKIWKDLYESGIKGIIRGDEGFGWLEVSSKLTTRSVIDCKLCTDIKNLKKYSKEEFLYQEFPENLDKRKNETLSQWRDRLYHEFRIPIILAALSDLKFGYVEQINPLLGRQILQTIRKLPDHLRTNKYLFKRIVDSIGPKIEYARSGANIDVKDFLRKKEVYTILKNEINSENCKNIFPAQFLSEVKAGLKVEEDSNKKNIPSKKSIIIKLIPRFIKNFIRDKFVLPSEDYNVLAFRILIINRMIDILNNDKKLIS